MRRRISTRPGNALILGAVLLLSTSSSADASIHAAAGVNFGATQYNFADEQGQSFAQSADSEQWIDVGWGGFARSDGTNGLRLRASTWTDVSQALIVTAEAHWWDNVTTNYSGTFRLKFLIDGSLFVNSGAWSLDYDGWRGRSQVVIWDSVGGLASPAFESEISLFTSAAGVSTGRVFLDEPVFVAPQANGDWRISLHAQSSTGWGGYASASFGNTLTLVDVVDENGLSLRSQGFDVSFESGITPTAPAAVPEPASLAIWGMGLIGLALFTVRRRRMANARE